MKEKKQSSLFLTTNQEKQKILMQANITRDDIAMLTDLKYPQAQKIFDIVKHQILIDIRKEYPDFNFLNNRYIPTIHALPHLKRYGVDKNTIFKNAEIEKENL